MVSVEASTGLCAYAKEFLAWPELKGAAVMDNFLQKYHNFCIRVLHLPYCFLFFSLVAAAERGGGFSFFNSNLTTLTISPNHAPASCAATDTAQCFPKGAASL